MSEIMLPIAVRGVPLAVRLVRDGVTITASAEASIPTRLGPVRIAVSVSIDEAPIRALLERAMSSELAQLGRDFFSDPGFVAEVGKVFEVLPSDAEELARREVLRKFARSVGGVLAQAEAAFNMGDAGPVSGWADADRYTREIERAIGSGRGRYGLGPL